MSNSTWHLPRNRRKPRKLEPCRRLLQSRDASFPERHGPRGSRSAGSNGPSHRVDHPRRLHKSQGRRKPSLSSFFTSKTTRAPTRSRLRSDPLIAVYPSLLPAWGFGAAPVTQDTLRAITSQPVPAEKIVCRWPWRPGKGKDRRSPRWLPLCVIRFFQRNRRHSSIAPKSSHTLFRRNSIQIENNFHFHFFSRDKKNLR